MMEKRIGKNRKILKIAGIIALCIVATLFVGNPSELASSDLHPVIVKEKIAIIADIHAASQDKRTTSDPKNIVYPSMYKDVLTDTFKKLKENETNLTIILGDNTNNSSETHAKKLKAIADEQKMKVLWLKGNHEKYNSNVMEVLGVEKNYFYYFDKNDWRIIVLNTEDEHFEKDVRGNISEEQLKWIDDALNTDHFILIAMHRPIWERGTLNAISPEYAALENTLARHRNVRYVFSGHWHTESWEKNHNSIEYYQIPAFLLEGNVGYYKIVELESYIY